jgi:hypothetical protein
VTVAAKVGISTVGVSEGAATDLVASGVSMIAGTVDGCPGVNSTVVGIITGASVAGISTVARISVGDGSTSLKGKLHANDAPASRAIMRISLGQ